MTLFLKRMSTTSTLFCRRREEQSAKLRKTAEKLLLNQLKKHALKNMSGSQQAAVLQQAKQTSTAGPTDSEEIPADLLVSALNCWHTTMPCMAEFVQYLLSNRTD